jgi:hypothetical protein
MLIPRNSPIPPGGYHFPDRSGPQENVIQGTSFEDVAARVTTYRLQNARPLGNPLEEVYGYVCSHWPHLCNDTTPKPPVHNPDYKPSLAIRTSDWMGRFITLLAPGDPGVSQETADARSHICANCPQNKNYRGGCGSCVQSIESSSFVYLRNRKASETAALGACDALSEHLPTSIWSDKQMPVDNPSLPDNCWRKK